MAISTDNSKEYFVKDFYRRTLALLNSIECEYDVALLINCAVGLLIVPKEIYFSKKVDESFVDEELLRQVRGTFQNLSDDSLNEILKRLRNAICHGKMKIKAEEPNQKD